MIRELTALISETHFTPKTKFKITGYTLISSNHPDNTAHAGAAILVKSTLQFTCLPIINNDFLQAALININLHHVPITIPYVYIMKKHFSIYNKLADFAHFISHKK